MGNWNRLLSWSAARDVLRERGSSGDGLQVRKPSSKYRSGSEEQKVAVLLQPESLSRTRRAPPLRSNHAAEKVGAAASRRLGHSAPHLGSLLLM